MITSNLKHITSTDNQLIKHAIKLANDSAYRQAHNQAIIYGEKIIIEALRSGLLGYLFIESNQLNKYQALLLSYGLNISKTIITIPAAIMHKINILDNFFNVVAIINIRYNIYKDDYYKYAQNNHNNDCILLENIQNPNNLGAILRTAGAMNINTIFLSQNCVDPYNPKVLRASSGMQFTLNIVNKSNLLTIINNYQGRIFATSPYANNSLYDTNLSINSIAWIFGNEGAGLSDEIINCMQDKQSTNITMNYGGELEKKLNNYCAIKIPINANAESLNIVTAVTVCLFEMGRQRYVYHNNK